MCTQTHMHTDRKVAGVISRIRRMKKKISALPKTYTPPHTHTHTHRHARTHFISHPPGSLLSRHPNPLKITFSYYPNNGGTECNFNSCSENETRNRTLRLSLVPPVGWRSG